MLSVSLAASISGFSEKNLFYGFFPEKKILNQDLTKLSELDTSVIFSYHQKNLKRLYHI